MELAAPQPQEGGVEASLNISGYSYMRALSMRNNHLILHVKIVSLAESEVNLQ